MGEQTGDTSPHPEAVGMRWGYPISRERKAELQGYLDQWEVKADHGRRWGPFDQSHERINLMPHLRLTGADVYWLAARSGRDQLGYLPNLHLERADLYGASLTAADLSGASLIGAELSEADLRNANFSKANLAFANVRDANLTSAHLSLATLRYATLAGADLSKADLTNANLSDALVRDANLTGAELGGADLSRADLSGASVALARGIRLFSLRQLLLLTFIALGGVLALFLWMLLDGVTHWTTIFPWLSGSFGVGLTMGALILLLKRGGNTRLAQQNYLFITGFLRANIIALFLFLAGVSHIYQALFLWFGGFTSATPDYMGWLTYQGGWFVDILLFNVFDVYSIPVSPIRPDALWSQTLVFVLNLVLVAVVVQATLRAYSDIQFWRLRIRNDYY
jgi:Pentapeptide repeats (8 copies)